MRRTILFAALCALPGAAMADDDAGGGQHSHGQHMQMQGQDHADHMMPGQGAALMPGPRPGMAMATPSEPGQGAFGAIAEIVARLEADPATDWSAVDIDVLRAHLRDMNLVTLQARTEAEPADMGMRFTVTGTGDVIGAIQRMTLAHAGIMDGTHGWHFQAEVTATGALLTVEVPEADQAKLAGLGFFGLMASGMHHQPHHWAMATGTNPHR